MPYTLPPLPYAADALEPYIDHQTMELHHGTHHASYVKGLNAALAQHPHLAARSIEDLLRHIHQVPHDIRAAVRHNGGGHVNHSLFWLTIGPRGGGRPQAGLAEAIDSFFGGFDRFKETFGKAALSRFGSGWAWLVSDERGRLSIERTANEDSPLMEGAFPLLGLDVWEHAYYLRCHNRRTDYVNAWWRVIDWAAVSKRLVGTADTVSNVEIQSHQ